MHNRDECVMLVEDEEFKPLFPKLTSCKIGHPSRKSAFQSTQSNIERHQLKILNEPIKIQNQDSFLNAKGQKEGKFSPELQSFIHDLKSQCKEGTYLYIPIEVKNNQLVRPGIQLPVYYQRESKTD